MGIFSKKLPTKNGDFQETKNHKFEKNKHPAANVSKQKLTEVEKTNKNGNVPDSTTCTEKDPDEYDDRGIRSDCGCPLVEKGLQGPLHPGTP